MEQIVVGMADCRVAAEAGNVLATFALGSCIGLSVFDTRSGVSGLLHYMLPDSGIDPNRARENPYMFADTGIPLLIEKMCALGANKRSLVAHAAGGAAIMDPNNVFDIGKRNHLAMRKLLWKAGILLSGEAVGGVQSRTVRLEVGTGKLWLQEGCGQRELVPNFPRGGGAAKPAASGPAPASSPPRPLMSAPLGALRTAPVPAATPAGNPAPSAPAWRTLKGDANGIPGTDRR